MAEAGRSGVEVWLDEGQGKDAKNVTVAIKNPRCLAMSVSFLGQRILFVLAHGLVAVASEEQIRLWWDTFAAELVAAAQDQNVVLLIDASASLNDIVVAAKRPNRAPRTFPRTTSALDERQGPERGSQTDGF